MLTIVLLLLLPWKALSLSCMHCMGERAGAACPLTKNTVAWNPAQIADARCMIVVADGIVFRQSLTSVTECQDLDLEERLKSDHGFRTVSITCCSKENLCNKDFQSSLSSESVQAIENVENIGNELVANAGSLARGGESPQSQIDKLLEENSVSRPSGSFLWTFLTIITMNVMLKLLK